MLIYVNPIHARGGAYMPPSTFLITTPLHLIFSHWASVTFPKIYVRKYLWKFFSKILVMWPVITSSATWSKFRFLQKMLLGMSMIYRWNPEHQGIPTSPEPTSDLNYVTGHVNLKFRPIRRLHFWNWWRHRSKWSKMFLNIYLDLLHVGVYLYQVWWI